MIKSAKPMSNDYNEKVACWTFECTKMSLEPIEKALQTIPKARFDDIKNPFVIAEYGCATGFGSIKTFATLIKSIKTVNPKMPITIYLNDLPSNHHEIAINTVTEGLTNALEPALLSDFYLFIAAKDFTQ
jgi:hypothetical protein